jgi:hypothetical protein
MNNWGAALHSLAEISARTEALAFLESGTRFTCFPNAKVDQRAF